MKFSISTIFLISTVLRLVHSLDNGLALRPPMAWMAWERYRCLTNCDKYPDECISEKLIKQMADLMASEGYLEAGYEYINIDDCWSELERDENGKIVADRKRFPSGIKALSDYVHSKGLKFGLYGNYGTKTCANYPGSIDHMEIDAKSLAEWGVDFWKFDGCNVKSEEMVEGYIKFGKLMNETGRPILYSCSWPAYFEYYRKPTMIPDYEVLKKTCNMWRNWKDIDDSWESVNFISDYFAENQDRIQPHAGPGHWNDPDTLLLGNYGLSYDQSKAQMAIWTILAAPLIMSNDLKNIRPEIKEILLNKNIIEVNQDILGIQGKRMAVAEGIEVWVRPITPINYENHYSYAVAYVSRRTDGHPAAISASLEALNFTNPGGYEVTDLFTNKIRFYRLKQGTQFEERVNPSGVNFYKYLSLNSQLDEISDDD